MTDPIQDMDARIRELLGEAPALERQTLPADPGLHTGIPMLDLQHEDRVAAYRRLVEQVRNGASEEDQNLAFRRLTATALSHFAAEDALMAQCAYARRREHQSAHAGFIAQVSGLPGPHRAPSPPFAPEILDFLEEWLAQHMQEDRMLARFLGGHGH